MVAIYAPQPELDEWSPAPGAAPGRGSRSRRVGRRPARPLPDRATRFRRRRLAALVVATVALALAAAVVQLVGPALGSAGGAGGDGDGPPAGGDPSPVAGEVYVVQPGDTLWSIAARVAPGDDPRPVVDRLQAAHGDAALEVGDRLVVDVG